jgi:hypothetical protein
MRLAKYGTCVICGLLLCTSVLSAQEQEKKEETNVEAEYMQSVEDQVISELANNESRDDKVVALQMLEEAAAEGRVTPDMMNTLDRLAGEGITNRSTTGGRVMNNYPDIRKRACEILASVKTEESKNILKTIALNDNEPMVLSAAIKSLGTIGINEGDEVISAINWAQKRNMALNPTSSMAFEVLTAYEMLAPTVENKQPMLEEISKIAANNRYTKSVRNRAKALLKKFRDDSGKK